jgi:hypothetical protein
MATQAIPIERRQHPREGIIGQLENITYTILRKHGIGAEAPREAVSAGTSQAGVQKRCRTLAACREQEAGTTPRYRIRSRRRCESAAQFQRWGESDHAGWGSPG